MSRASNLNRIIYEMGNGYVPTILVPVNYRMLALDLQFMLGVCHGHSLWFSSASTPQIGKDRQVWFFKKATVPDANSLFTGQRQVTPSTGWSKSCPLQWRLQVGQIICVASSLYCWHHLIHSWRLSINWAPILTKDILSKITCKCNNHDDWLYRKWHY